MDFAARAANSRKNGLPVFAQLLKYFNCSKDYVAIIDGVILNFGYLKLLELFRLSSGKKTLTIFAANTDSN